MLNVPSFVGVDDGELVVSLGADICTTSAALSPR